MAVHSIHQNNHIQSSTRIEGAATNGSNIRHFEIQGRRSDVVDFSPAPARSPLFDAIAGKVRETAGQHLRGIIDPEDDIAGAVGASPERNPSEDKMGNFEIQGLMSDLNEAQTLTSHVLKSMNDASDDILHRIG